MSSLQRNQYLLFSLIVLLFLYNCASMASSSSLRMDEADMTPLQKHAAFFDRNNDGLIYPWETFQGFRAIGAGVALSTGAAFLINSVLGPKTQMGSFPSPFFPIYVQNIKKGKHGSDTGVYDTEGSNDADLK